MPPCLNDRLKYLNPDKVVIYIDWESFPVGGSVFIPCINTVKLVSQLSAVAKFYEFKLTHRHRIEGGKWGLRVWRLL